MQRLSAPRTMKKSAGFVGRISVAPSAGPTSRIHPCLAPSAGDHNRRMTIRASLVGDVFSRQLSWREPPRRMKMRGFYVANRRSRQLTVLCPLYFTLTFMMRIATPRMMKNPLVFVGRIRPPGRHPPVHPLESKPCRAPSAIANNRRMALRLSALRSELRRLGVFFTLTVMARATPNNEKTF